MDFIGMKKMQGSVVEVLKDGILSGEIPEGTELTQNELAADLGVSRMPVREALILLEYQGLVIRLPNNHVKTACFPQGYFSSIFRKCGEMEAEVLKAGGWQTETRAFGLGENGGFRNDGISGFGNVEGGFDFEKELDFHRNLYCQVSHSFFRKTMETMVEIYVAFAIGRGSYNRADGLLLLERAGKEAGLGHIDQMKTALYSYFDRLAEAVVKERKQKCSD